MKNSLRVLLSHGHCPAKPCYLIFTLTTPTTIAPELWYVMANRLAFQVQFLDTHSSEPNNELPQKFSMFVVFLKGGGFTEPFNYDDRP